MTERFRRTTCHQQTKSPISELLTRIMRQAISNSGANPKGRRYQDQVLVRFAINIWILGGRRTYEILYSNLQGAFPSPSTVQVKLSKFETSLIEGAVNAKYLKKYLLENNLPLMVVLSEDATAVVSRREYMSKPNCILGCSLPLGESGLPDASLSVTKTLVDMARVLRLYPRATVAMVVMAQPLADGVAAMRVCSFGSDNRFTASDVKNRLKTIISILKLEDIDVFIYSADGDSREFKTMRELIELGTAKPKDQANVFSKNATWFAATMLYRELIISVQDHIHEAAKLRTRFLKSHMILPFGNSVASPSDVIQLMGSTLKTDHLLKEGDVLLQDKMNYGAAARLFNPALRDLLSKHVAGSEATCFFLLISDYITSSFLDKELTPLERVYRIWYAVLGLRYWRFWMSCDDAYPLSTNFISLNAYLCAELNAHSLVLILLKLKKMEKPEFFMPWLFGSQACESFFRAIRALCPVGSIQTNFTFPEFQRSRCRKVDIMIPLIANGREDGIIYPRHVKEVEERYGGNKKARLVFELPSAMEIEKTIAKALDDVKRELNLLGVEVKGDDGRCFDFDSRLAEKFVQKPSKTKKQQEEEETNEDELVDECEIIEILPDENSTEEEVDRCDLEFLSSIYDAKFRSFENWLPKRAKTKRDYPECFSIQESPFVPVPDSQGDIRIVKKSTVLWFLEQEARRLSNDRTLRVRVAMPYHERIKLIVKAVERRKIRLGDWCVFKTEKNTKNKIPHKFLLGRVLSFSVVHGSSQDMKRIIWSWSFEEGHTNIGVLCIWYAFEQQNNGELHTKVKKMNVDVHGYCLCTNYLCSIPPPQYDHGCVSVPSNVIVDMLPYVQRLM